MDDMTRKKKYGLPIIIFVTGILLCACKKEEKISDQSLKNTNAPVFEEGMGKIENITEQIKKGYDLPINDSEKSEAKKDCKSMMELVTDIYKKTQKGQPSDVVLSDEAIFEMQNMVKETGQPVTTAVAYSDMANYQIVENFLNECMEGKRGSAVVYEIHSDGGIGRSKYIFDGKDMYVLTANASWNSENKPVVSYISYTRIKTWKYTKKGWFCYEVCVPQPPEVSEIIDGNCLVRIKPLTKEQRKMSIKCVRDIGYQGNNLLCSNWDIKHLDKLDYNGLFEYLYRMKYQKKFNFEDYPNGIPKKMFENLMMEYLPVTAEQIRKYAAFDEENQTYLWMGLSCLNYAPNYFGIALPEVTAITENEDGTVTLRVDAVCDMEVCDDAVITHELTVRFNEDGSFQYLGNKILNNGINDIPAYQYRILEK